MHLHTLRNTGEMQDEQRQAAVREGKPLDTPDRESAPGSGRAERVARNTVFDWWLDRIAWACRVVTGLGLVVLTVIFGWLVYGRYVLNATPTWVEQVSLLLVMLITFVGAAIGVHERTHLSVDFFRLALPRPLRIAVGALGHLVLGGFGAVMMWHSAKLAMFKWGSLIPLIGVPEGLRAIPITVCGALIVLFSLGHLIAILRGYDDDETANDNQ